jgi:Tfp pilus assembly protein PilF
MNTKFLIFLSFFIINFFFLGCGKKSNVKLAQTYYKFALLELSEKPHDDQVYKQALDYIEKALEQESKPEYLAFKATLLFRLGKNQEGSFYFDQALKQMLDPKLRAEILNNKACLLAEVGVKTLSEKDVQQALTIWLELENDKSYLTPEVALFNQSKVYLSKKDFGLAKTKLLEAINISPSFLDAHYYLALVSYRLKDLDLAKNEAKTVLFLEPTHEGAKYLSDLLDK